jgi:hypothetical protein
MNPVRNLLRDLVERRLWPIALLLVVAAVAVPVYLGRSSSDDGAGHDPHPGATANATVKASKAAVSLDESADESDGVGKTHNPFKQHKAKAADTDTSSKPSDKPSSSGDTSQAGGASPSSGSSPSGGSDNSTPSGGSTPSGSNGTGTSGDTTKPKGDVTHVTLHLGPLGTLTTYKDVARLSPLPSAAKPLFVFTGVLSDGKTAVLLPSSTVQIGEESDVSCKPSNKSCQKLEVQQDDTIFFKIAGDTAGTQYQLDVVSVHLKKGESAKAAAAALGRHSNAGAAMLRDAHVYGSSEYQGADDYRFMPDTGLLDRVPEHGTGAAAASAGDAAAALPGLPVWHWRDDS